MRKRFFRRETQTPKLCLGKKESDMVKSSTRSIFSEKNQDYKKSEYCDKIKGEKNMMKFSMYMEKDEVGKLDEARERLMSTLGIHISRNEFLRSLLMSLMNGNEDNGYPETFKSSSNAKTAAEKAG